MDPTTTESARLSKSALFLALGYSPHLGQVEVHRSKAQRRILVCGSRWGKSLCASMEACAAILEPREQSLGWIVAPTRDLVDRTFMRVVDAIKSKFRARIQHLDLRIQQIVIANLGGGRSELRGKSADMPVSLLGEACDYLIIDEAAKLRVEVWQNHLAQRLVDRKGWVLFLSTPNGCNWLFDLCRQIKMGRDPDGQAWCSPSWENPHIDRAVIDAERARLPADVFAQEYGGVFLGEELLPCLRCGNDRNGIGACFFDFEVEGKGTCSDCGGYIHEDGVSMEAGPGRDWHYVPKVGVTAGDAG
ncbi:MAG: terminase large subunit domain-containing protein [Planctomycetota bacterium]